MSNVSVKYSGNLCMECVHNASGAKLAVTPSPEHGGKGDSFSPTDLCATSVACCASGVVGVYAASHGLNVDGMEVEVSKSMASGLPQRLGKIELVFKMPDRPFSDKDKLVIERVAQTCAVHHSLHPDVEQVFRFEWQR